MDVICRTLGEEEQRDAFELGRLAFGAPALEPDAPLPVRPGRILWGAFAGGRLVATTGDRVQGQWFGGRLLKASGISSVVVAPGERGKGYAKLLVAEVLASARERGAVVSTLFPTAPALYRGLGCEETGVFTWWDVSAATLASVRTPAGHTTRPATHGDRDTVLALYRTVAAAGSGYLERDADRFPGWPFHKDYEIDGVTLAVAEDGEVTGYAAWQRGLGFGTEARLTVPDLIGSTAGATAALLASLGSWSAVLATVSLLLPRPDPAWWLIPAREATVRSAFPWMTRVLDAPAAVASRGWPAAADVSLDLDISDATCPWNQGRFTLEVSQGHGRLTPGGGGDVSLGARGLAVLFAGGVSAAQLRRSGLLDGGDDARIDALMSGPAPTTLNFF